MSDFETLHENFNTDEEQQYDSTHLWVISYSDFMTILMIFFLMLFAHRVWAKKIFWESQRVAQLRAVQEAQRGMVQRLTRLASVEVQAQRIQFLAKVEGTPDSEEGAAESAVPVGASVSEAPPPEAAEDDIPF